MAFLLAHDAAIFLLAGLLAAAVAILARRRQLDRGRVVGLLLFNFLLFSGVLRFALLFARDLFFPEAAIAVQAPAAGGDALDRLAFAELAIATLAAFGLRASVPVRIAAVVPLAVVQVAPAVFWLMLWIAGQEGLGVPAFDLLAELVAGLVGLLLLALDWAQRSEGPDPLEPGGKSYTY